MATAVLVSLNEVEANGVSEAALRLWGRHLRNTQNPVQALVPYSECAVFRRLTLPLVLSLPGTRHGITYKQMGASCTKEGIALCSRSPMPPAPASTQPASQHPSRRIPPRATAEPPPLTTSIFPSSQYLEYDPGSRRSPLDLQDGAPAPGNCVSRKGRTFFLLPGAPGVYSLLLRLGEERDPRGILPLYHLGPLGGPHRAPPIPRSPTASPTSTYSPTRFPPRTASPSPQSSPNCMLGVSLPQRPLVELCLPSRGRYSRGPPPLGTPVLLFEGCSGYYSPLPGRLGVGTNRTC